MEGNPLISIITVVFNDVHHIESTIRSVIEQTYDQIEYLIVDGSSTDGTMDIVSKYKKDIDMIVSEPDNGIYDAMNKGLQRATGDYVLFLNSADRLYETDTFERIFSKPGADIYYGETAYYDENDRFLGIRSAITTRTLPEKLTYRNFLTGMPVAHQSFIVRKEIAPKYDLRYFCSADIDWCIQCLKNGYKIQNTGLVISRYLIGGVSHKNRQKCWRERFEILRIHFGLINALAFQLFVAIRFLYKYILRGKRY